MRRERLAVEVGLQPLDAWCARGDGDGVTPVLAQAFKTNAAGGRQRGHERLRRATRMSIETVRAFLAQRAPDVTIVELARSSATATLAAEWNIRPAQIAKALTLRVGTRDLLLVTCGDSRLDNRKVKAALGGKVRLLPADEAASVTGHPVGGVCPFGLASPLPIYCDVQLRRFDVVVTGGGSTHSALRIDPLGMAELVGAEWVDVCEAAL
jgi:prolyl-tRNA editing enzyme YbaK/EbsC (Cys-tRNA(Pro) deacylase)